MAIAFFGATTYGVNNVGSGTVTFSHNSGSNAGSILFVQTMGDDTIGTAVTGVTYNGVAMNNTVSFRPTAAPFGTNCPWITIWTLISPATGTNNVAITYTGRSGNAIASTYYGCSGTQSFRNSYGATTAGSTNTKAQNVSGGLGSANNWLLGFAYINNSSVGELITASTNTTSRARLGDFGQFGYMTSDNNGNGADTLNWTTAGGTFWNTVALEIVPSTSNAQMLII